MRLSEILNQHQLPTFRHRTSRIKNPPLVWRQRQAVIFSKVRDLSRQAAMSGYILIRIAKTGHRVPGEG